MALVALVLSLIWFAQKPAAPDSCSRLPASSGPFESLNTCRAKLGGSANDSKINSPAWLVENYLEVDYTTVFHRVNNLSPSLKIQYLLTVTCFFA
jgi:hypothetical protein